MATYTSTSGNYKTTLTVTETSTSIPNNTSTLSWSLKVERIGGASQYGIHNANQCPWSVSINGSRVGSGTFSYDFRYTGSYNLGSGNNVTVAHNNDGTKTGVAVSGTVDLDNSAYVSVMTASGTIDLTTIPRASDISLSVGSYNVTSSSGNAFTYTITAKSTSFYNRLRYTLGSTNYTGSGSTGSRSGNFTNAELLTSLPTATSGSLTAYVDTATDSGFTNIIGTNSVSIPISINTSYIKPSITLQNLSVNNSPISGYAVAGYSKVQCGTSSSKWSASGGYGSNAITVTFTTSHGSLAQSSYSASSNSISNYTVTNVLPSSSSNYTLTISATARDSRGATTSASKTYTVYGYTPPTANLTAYRVASSGSTAEDGAGTFAYVAFSGAVSSSVNNQNSIQSTTCTYSGSISGTATSGGHYALSDTQTVTFTLTVRDKVTSSTAQKTINTATYPLDLYDNGSGSVGVGLGTVAEGSFVKIGAGIHTKGNWFTTNNIIKSDLNQIAEGIVHFNPSVTNRPCDYGVCYTLGLDGDNSSSQWYSQIAFGTNGIIYFRNSINTLGQTWSNWYAFYGEFNVQPSVAVATSAGTLTTPRTINGTAFNGGADIRTATSYNIDIGALGGTSAYTAFARTPNSNASGNMSMTLLVTGAGRFGGVYQGAWLVQLSNRGSVRSMHVTSLIPNSEATVTFGHYASGDYFYFGVSRPTYGGALQITVLQAIGGGGVADYYTSANQPSGWTPVSNRDPATRTLWTGSLLGGNSITLSDATRFRKFKLYAWMGATIAYEWEVDRDYITTSARKFSHGELIWIADPGGWYNTHAEVNIYSSGESIVFNFANARNIRVDGTNHVVTQNNNSNYRIYRIDGIL